MCDSLVITKKTSEGEFRYLLKNSDREPIEAQEVFLNEGLTYPSSQVRTSYRLMNHVRKPFRCALSKPFHMWGAEMGQNEYGLAIANEAVFTRFRFKKNNEGLTGMDMIRLALESCKSAEEAVHKISNWIETIGQDACGGYKNKKFYYHNSFLICDPNASWKLESAGRFWAAKKINEEIESISNGLSIRSDYDLGSKGMAEYALKKGWIGKQENFDFTRAFSDKLFRRLTHCELRRNTTRILGSQTRRMDLVEARDLLSFHNHSRPDCLNASSICMHANSLFNPSQTTGSMIAVLDKVQPYAWFTGTSNPCMSIFFPLVPETEAIQMMGLLSPEATPDSSLWWSAYLVQKSIMMDYENLYSTFRSEQNLLQLEIIADWERSHQSKNIRNLLTSSARAIEKIQKFYSQKLKELIPSKNRTHWRYRLYRHMCEKNITPAIK